MAADRRPRPTRTDWQSVIPQVSDDWYNAYENQMPQEVPQEEAGFFGRAVESAKAVGEGLTFLPGGVVDTVQDAVFGFDPTDKEEMAQRAQRENELQAYQQKYAGQAWEGVTDAMTSIPYSAVTMGAGLLGGVGGAFTGPVGAGAASMAASGTTAYRASVAEFERTMYGVTSDALGREPSPEEWARVRDNFAGEATKYGLWEAGPEAVSNLLMAKILGPLGSKFKGGVKDVIKRVAGLYGEELATETVTQMGQGTVQADLGLRETAPSTLEAFQEVAPATFWQTTLMAGGKKGLDLAFRRARGNEQAGEPMVPEEQNAPQPTLNEARGQLLTGLNLLRQQQQPTSTWMPENADQVNASELAALRQSLEQYGTLDNLPKPTATWLPHGAPKPDPFLPEDSEDLTDWLKETEAKLDREFGPEIVAGQSVDLLDWTAAEADAISPHAALPVGGPAPMGLPAAGMAGAFALPQQTGQPMPPAVSTAIPMQGTAPSGRPIAPPTDFSTPIPQPATQRPLALPVQPLAGLNPGLWSGGKSQLAYGPKAMPQAMPAPAPIPSPAQITNTQQAPRADTTAQAQALGIPAPDVMPAEVQPVAGPQIPQVPQMQQAVPFAQSAPVQVPQTMPTLPTQATANLTNTPQALPQQTPSALPNTRSAMLAQVTSENKQLAKKLGRKPLARLVATEQSPEPFANVEWTREDYPMPTAEGGTVFTSGSGRKMAPFPVVDYSTPQKHKKSNGKAATWLLDEAMREAAGNQSFTRYLNNLTPGNLPPATVNELADVLAHGAPEETPHILKSMPEPVQDTADTQIKPSEVQARPEGNAQTSAEQTVEEGYPKPKWSYGLPSFVTAQYGGKNSSAQEKQGESSSVPKAGVVKSTQQEEENRTTPKEKNHAPEQSTIGEGYNRGHEVEGTEPVQGAERERGAGSRSNAPSGSGGRGLRAGVVGSRVRTADSEGREAGTSVHGEGSKDARNRKQDMEGSSGAGVRVSDRGRTERTERNNQRDKLDKDGRLKKAGVQDYSAPEGSLTRTGSWKETALRNLDIIELAKKLTKEGRQATAEEQAQLARYTGFGASEIRNKLFPVDREGNVLSREIQPHRVVEDWRPLAERAKSMLSADEVETLLQSTQYAHYTSESVIRSIWNGLQRLGFYGGNILEPGMGTGLFAVAGPKDVTDASQYTGIEMDKITAEIAGHILPASNVLNADFTKTKFPDNFFDLAIGNPPFAGIKILSDPAYRKHRFSLHDYFFAKSMNKVRPGGLLVFVTSRYTMDKQEDKARQYLAERADLVGAIRLPQSAFMKNAGTEVVTDVLFLRKRLQGEQAGGEEWAGLQEVKTQEGEALINEYFVKHPEMVLGSNSLKGSMYSKNEYTVLPMEGDIETHFAKAVQSLPAGVYAKGVEVGSMLKAKALERDFNPNHTKEGGVYLDDGGNLRRLEDGSGVDLSTVRKLNDREREWMHDYVGLRDALKQAQYDQLNYGEWEQSLTDMNKKYAEFVEKHGRIRDYTESVRMVENEDGEQVERIYRRYRNAPLLNLDIEGPLVQNLEDIKENGEIENGPFLKGRTIKKPTAPQIKTTQDALMVSLDLRGVLDLDSVAELAGKNRDEVIDELGDSIYEAPDGLWKMADEYLSGDVVTKLEEAEAAARIKPRFDRNVQALIKVQPTPIEAKNINVDLGANWIPIEYINGFAKEVLQLGNSRISYNRDAGLYNVAGTGARRVAGESEWGTPARNPEDILEAVLNSRSITIRWTDAEKRTHVDNEATAAANEKADAIREAFQNWVWQDAERVSSLVALYNRTFNNMAPRRFDGTHLTLPGLSLRYKLYDHQKRAIWRIIQTGNTYLAHAVGAGKTLEMIVAGMEQRRLGLVRRPMYVVPNHMLDQFSKEFLDAYPLANIMVADENHFDKANRRRFIAQASINDPDAIVITHSAFGRIGLKEETIRKTSEAFIKQLESALEDVDKSERITRSRLEKRLEQAKQQMDKRISKTRDQGVFFEEMGVDFLFVDEAHEFRKLDFVTNRDNVKGISPAGSAMSMDLFAKLSWMHEQNPTRSHVLASGTPVTNTMAEMYTLMRYMDPESLERDGLETFDAWASMFGRVRKELEQNAAGKYEFVERFSKFVNVPELMKRVRSFMDVLTMDKLGQYVKRPDLKGGVPGNVVTPTSEAVRKYLDTELSERIKQSRNWRPSPGVRGNPDPMLRIISDGRLAALDLRFVQPDAADDPDSKLNLMVKDIIKTYEDTKSLVYTGAEGTPDAIPGGTQIVFSSVGFGDQVAQSRGFDLRADITRKLKDAGIKPGEIAWMSDYKSTAQKGNLFADMRAGKVRVLFGSPKNMGTGVNVQKRLVKLHYLSPPWFPSDVEQPHGRILRQGNQNAEVSINWYATKGTYDSTMWGMVARKAKFIEQALNGDDSVRSIEDISESSTYEMASALAAGDERVIQLAGLNADVERLNRLKRAHSDEQRRFRSEIHRLESLIKKREGDIPELDATRKVIEAEDPARFRLEVDGVTYDKQGEAGTAMYEALTTELDAWGPKGSGEYKTVTVGKLFGKFPVKVRLEVGVVEGGKKKVPASMVVDYGNKNSDEVSYHVFNEKLTASGLVGRMHRNANGYSAEIREVQQRLEEERRSLEKFRSRLGTPFPQEGELAEKVAEAGRLKAELAADGAKQTDVESTEIDGPIESVLFAAEDGPKASLAKDDRKPVRVVDVDPSSIPVDTTDTKKLVAWLRDYYGGRSVTINDTGENATFTNRGLRESAKRRGEAQRQGYAALDRLLEQSVFDGFEGADARHAAWLRGQNIYVGAMRLGDSLYAVKFKMDVPLHGNGLHYKDHKVTEIEIAPTLYQSSEAGGSYTLQKIGAIREVSLGVLRGAVKPSHVNDGILSSLSPGEFLPPRKETRQRLRGAAVRRVADALSNRAKNAVPTRVVDTFDELPARLRSAFAEQADLVEGVYYDGTVWLVAENLTDKGRTADVWAHEQVVHGGLRSLFGKERMGRLMRQLWNAVGGMGNKGVAEIAHRYGLNPRANLNDRAIVMEEYLASLEEKRRDEFTIEERTAWHRFVRAVADMWNRLVEAVTGRSSCMGMKEVEALLSALEVHVMDGAPMGAGGRLTSGEALASLDGDTENFFYDSSIFPSLRTDPDPKKTVKAYKLFRVRKDKPGKLFPLFVSADEAVGMGVWLDAEIGAATPDGKVKSKLGGLAMRPGWHAGDAPVATHIGDKRDKADKAPSLRSENQVWAEIEAADEVDWQTEANRRTEHTKDGEPIARTAHITDQIPKDGLYRYKTNPNMTGTWIITGSMKVNRILSDAEVTRINKAKGIADLPRLKPFEAEKYGFDDIGREDDDAPRASLRNVLRMGVRDTVKLAEESTDIGKFFAKSEDLSMSSRILNLPHWIAKEFPGFARIYNRQLKRMDERNADRVKSMGEIPSIFGDKPISGADMDALREFIWQHDGKQIKELGDTPKFIDREVLASGRPLLDKNPEWDKAYRAWINRQKLPDAAKKAMIEIRMSLDNDLMRTHNRMAHMSEFSTSDLQEFRSTINHVHNYFPHHRYGQYYVQARVGNEVVYREHFDALNGAQAKKKALALINVKRAEYPGAKWSADKNERLPDEVYGVPLDTEAMEQVIKAATAKLNDKEKAKEIQGALHAAIADTLKARGWGSHAIGRKGIPGHETQDIVRVLYDYKSGLCGWTTKIEAARDFTQALANIDARETPKLWTYASQYVQDMLRNYDNVDRVVGNIKAAAFAWYLGGNIKTAVLNLTQNVIVGVPRLQLEVDGGVMTFLKAAQAALVDQVSGRKGKGLPDEEARLIQELYNDAVINDAYMEEVRGRMGDSGNKLLNKTMKALGWPMSVAERFNRASLALAAFRAARGGNLKEKTRLRLGIEGGTASYEQAKAFAEEMVRDSHFVYGKANMPEFMRSGTAGRVASALYTFRTFSHSLLGAWHWAIKEHGLAGAGMVAKGLGATVAMGGLASFPFYATAMALFQAVSGDDDDWTESVRKMLPENNLLRDMVCYGIPAMGGVNLGGSLKMETPLTQGLSKGSTPKEVLTDSIGDILGIPYDLFVVKPSKVMESMKYGNTWRAVEEVAPVAAKNVMQAWQLYSKGQTTQSGRPINDPGKQGARKLSASEFAGKVLGFQPVSSTKSYDAYAAQNRRDTVRSEKIGDLATAMLAAHESDDVRGMATVRKEMREWNEKMEREGKPFMRIKLADVQRRMVARRRETKATPKNAAKGKAFAQVWGG